MQSNFIKTLLFMTLVFVLGQSFAHSLPPQLKEGIQPPRWEKLGERTVKYNLDRDEIMVTAQEGRFSALKLLVKKGGINMHKMTIHFGDGSVQEVNLKNNIPAGGETRVIDLEGGRKRVIRKVVFWYDTKNLADRRAVVELWGRH